MVYAASLDQLPFHVVLPTSWTLGTSAQRDVYWQSLAERDAGIGSNLAADASARGTPVGFIAYDGTEDDDRNPVLTCTSLLRGSLSADEALDVGQRQNVEGISRSPIIVDEPVADRIHVRIGEVVRIRWREKAPSTDISSIGYLFVTGPFVITCVFRTATAAVAGRETEWQGILETFESGAGWSVSATIQVGVKPFEITSGAGAVWVADADSGELSRIDPKSNAVTTLDLRTGHSDALSPWAIGLDDDRLWVTTIDFDQNAKPIDGALLVIDPPTGEITHEVAIGRASMGLAFGFGSVWVSNGLDQTVLRIDERTLKVTATIRVGAALGPVGVGRQGVWVVDTSDGKVSRIDPSTNKVASQIDVAPELRTLAVGERGIWVASRDGLFLFDEISGKQLQRLDIGGVAGLVARNGTVWAAEGLGLAIHEIDETSAREIGSVSLNTNSWGITELDGTLWVVQPAAAENKFAEAKPGTVTRLDH